MSDVTKGRGRGPTIGKMGVARYHHLDRFGGTLAGWEVAEGWHFCPDWDEMLVGPGMPELESCLCGKGDAQQGES